MNFSMWPVSPTEFKTKWKKWSRFFSLFFILELTNVVKLNNYTKDKMYFLPGYRWHYILGPAAVCECEEKPFVPLLLINSTLCLCCLRSSSCQSSIELLSDDLICRPTWQLTLFSGSVHLNFIFIFILFSCSCPPFPIPTVFSLFKVKRNKAPSNPPALKLFPSEVPIGVERPEMGFNSNKKIEKEKKMWGKETWSFWEVGGDCRCLHWLPPNKRSVRIKPWRTG